MRSSSPMLWTTCCVVVLGCGSAPDTTDQASGLRAANSELQARLARGALNRGDLDDARDRSREALRLDPARSDALHVLARAELIAGRNREALYAAQRAASCAAEDPAAWLLVFDCADSAGEPRIAEDALDRAVELGSLEAEFARAALALEQRDDSLLTAFIARNPSHVPAVALYAEYLAQRGDVNAALATVEGALEHGTADSLVSSRARLRFELGITTPATRDDDQLPAADAALISASTALRDGRTTEALDAFRTAVADSPQAVAPRVGLGESLLRGGDRAGALAAFESALELDASDIDARLGAARVLILEADFAAATRHLERALANERENAPTRGLLVAAALGAGDLARARTEATALRRLDPGSALDLKCRELIRRAEESRR